MIREAKKIPRIIELQRKLASWGHEVSKIRCHIRAKKLLGRHVKKSLYCHVTTSLNAWSLLKATGTLTGTVFYGQMKRKLSFSALKVGLV